MLTLLLTFFLFNNILLFVGDFMYTKILLTLKTKFMELDNLTLINKILDNNILVSTLAKEELLSRSLDDLDVDDSILTLLINKLSIEDLWTIAKQNTNNHFTELVVKKLNRILDYYQNLNIKEFLNKKNEKQLKLYLLK